MEDVGLVLAGGGGKGSYFIGVWQALRELGIDTKVSALSGTSVGSLNSILFSNGSYETAYDIWSNIRSKDILTVDTSKFFDFILNLNLPTISLQKFGPSLLSNCSTGIFSREGLLNVIKNKIDLNTVGNSNLLLYSCVYNMESLQANYLKLNNRSGEEVKNILLASSALPLIFDKQEVSGNYYYDGGLGDNVPVKPLYDEGIRNFIIVHLDRSTFINKSHFTGANIIEIIPTYHQGDLINGVLDFSKKGVKRRITQGYADAISVLKPIYDLNLIQSKINTTLKTYVKDNS